jgi:predicted RecA/RadA family phage recombinase
MFAGKFLGVAMQSSPLGEESSIRVATTGVFEFSTNSKTWSLGELVGIDELPERAGLENQKVDTAVLAGAVGRVARREPTASTTILVKIKSKITEGGVV